ncbi:MAG TPA: AzlD domain-containing protein [Tepidiformaceae bacterium]|mgnify:FL=1|nr:AzlD domain-containing protein [Tepidiformaceae bacterium]
MSDTWLAVVIVGAAAIVMKAAGPVVLGGRPLPGRAGLLVAALAPALLAALVVTNTVGDGQSLVLDARVLGVGAAALCIAVRAPLLAAVVAAAVVTAVARALA